jgi:hypothetical protein
MRGEGGGYGVSAIEYSRPHGAQINLGDLTTNLSTWQGKESMSQLCKTTAKMRRPRLI